jgi:hypothetical protein
MGAPEMKDVESRLFASELRCAIYSVDHRLAPEAPHPAPLEDIYSMFAWLHANAGQLGLDPARIGIKGESGGGGFAAAAALYARDRQGPKFAFQHLIYPMIDDRTAVRRDLHPYVGEFVWTQENNYFGWRSLLGKEPGSADVSPYAAAARAAEVSGLPPIYISVGGLDLFLEENMIYADQLSRAGVPVELHMYLGVSRLLSGNECPRYQAGRARQSRGAAPLPARIGPCTGSVRLSRPQPQQIEGSHSGPLPRCSALCLQLSPGGCLVCYRRVSPIAARSGEGLLTELPAATPPWRQQPLFMPLSGRSCQPTTPGADAP